MIWYDWKKFYWNQISATRIYPDFVHVVTKVQKKFKDVANKTVFCLMKKMQEVESFSFSSILIS